MMDNKHKPKRTTYRTRLNEMVTTLRNDILTGKLQPDSFLPSELVLADQFQLSKDSIRKGLAILLEEHMIEKVPRIGTRVIGPGIIDKITMRLGYYRSLETEAELVALVEKFQQLHPHFAIQLIPIEFDWYLSPNMRGALEQNAFDLITINHQHIESFLESEENLQLLEPLDRKALTYPFLLSPFSKDNVLYAQPLIFSPIFLCYNREHFRAAALPEPDSSWRWPDLCQAAMHLTQPRSHVGISFQLPSINRWPLFLLQNQVQFKRDIQGRLILENDNFKEALKLSLSMFEGLQSKSFFHSGGDADSAMYFANQKASMIITSYFNLNYLRNVDFDYDITPLPYMREASTQLLISGMAVLKASKHKEAAKALVDFLVSDEAQLHIRKHTLSIPSNKIIAEETTGDELFRRPSRFFMYKDIIPTYRFYSDMNISYREASAMGEILKLYWAHLDDFETALRRLKEALESSAQYSAT